MEEIRTGSEELVMEGTWLLLGSRWSGEEEGAELLEDGEVTGGGGDTEEEEEGEGKRELLLLLAKDVRDGEGDTAGEMEAGGKEEEEMEGDEEAAAAGEEDGRISAIFEITNKQTHKYTKKKLLLNVVWSLQTGWDEQKQKNKKQKTKNKKQKTKEQKGKSKECRGIASIPVLSLLLLWKPRSSSLQRATV